MYPKHVLDLIIRPVILGLELDNNNIKGAEALMLFTAQQESNCGEYLTQIGGGPARSPWQIEKFTYDDRFKNYLNYRPDLLRRVLEVSGSKDNPEFDIVTGNLFLACAIARMVYRKSPLPIPEWDDLESMWLIYKSCYNSYNGAAQKHEFIDNCERVISYL